MTVFPGESHGCRGMAAQNALRDRSDAFLIHRLNCCHASCAAAVQKSNKCSLAREAV